jgi:hypothetical protein
MIIGKVFFLGKNLPNGRDFYFIFFKLAKIECFFEFLICPISTKNYLGKISRFYPKFLQVAKNIEGN